MDNPQRRSEPVQVLPYAPSEGKGMGAILMITAITAIGGFLFGYDTAVISGAIGYLEKYFVLDELRKGWAGASAIVGCIPGAMIAGVLSDRIGRKRVLILCAILYAISAITSAVPRTLTEFIIARFIGGVGIGLSSMVVPVYIAEISPEKYRGRLGALFQLGIVIGIFVVFFINMIIQRQGDEAWNELRGWRWMLGSETLPAVLYIGLLFLVPESPRWLALNNREDDARDIMSRLVGSAAADRELTAVLAVSRDDQGRFTELLAPQYRLPLLIAVALAGFAQFSGINSIMYYAPEIFKSAGGSTNAAFASAVWVGAINLVFTFVAIALVDKAGRKPLLAIGAAVQTVSLFAVGYMFRIGHKGPGVLLCILAYVSAFAMAMGPIPWIIISEIFPGRIRGRAASVGVFTIWVTCYIVAQTFPILNNRLGPSLTFWIYGTCSLASLVFVLAMIPETKGRTLEEIEASWRR